MVSKIDIWTGFPESFFVLFSLFRVVVQLASIAQPGPAQPGQHEAVWEGIPPSNVYGRECAKPLKELTKANTL